VQHFQQTLVIRQSEVENRVELDYVLIVEQTNALVPFEARQSGIPRVGLNADENVAQEQFEHPDQGLKDSDFLVLVVFVVLDDAEQFVRVEVVV